MYLSSLTISGFRQFGSGEKSITVPLNKGVTALVGRNDSGKTAIIDAIRFALLTRDHETVRLQPEDFHVASDGSVAKSIYIHCTLTDLDDSEKGAFLEYLSYEDDVVKLHIHWEATRVSEGPGHRRWLDIHVKCGKEGAGPALEPAAREMLAATYLKPLRDAEREMSSGRNSRLSQVLANLESIKQGSAFSLDGLDEINHDIIKKLSLLGFADFFAHHVKSHPGISSAQDDINNKYLKHLAVEAENIAGDIQFVSPLSDDFRLRQLLERLELSGASCNGKLGLGSSNLLFVGCELLLLGRDEGFPILLIEEPEAHLHPQRQLRLMEFLNKASGEVESGKSVQVIMTTHSPNLASRLPLTSLVMLADHYAFSLAQPYTQLTEGDYGFLQRFLDVTKANLFFAHGVIIVEGIAEAILLPTLAKLMGRDLTAHGVSIVNVGSTGVSRFSKIFQRKNEKETIIPIPIANITDRDIIPECAPLLLGIIDDENDPKLTDKTKRKWRRASDFTDEDFQDFLSKKHLNDGQNVKTFVSDKWTLEYDLAFYGLYKEMHQAIQLAKNDDAIQGKKKNISEVRKESIASLPTTGAKNEIMTAIYSPLYKKNASKSITAQYLCGLLEEKVDKENLTSEEFAKLLPPYIVQAIDHATGKSGKDIHE